MTNRLGCPPAGGQPNTTPGDMRIPWTHAWRYPYSEPSTDFRTRDPFQACPIVCLQYHWKKDIDRNMCIVEGVAKWVIRDD